jgi:hypothetical protein
MVNLPSTPQRHAETSAKPAAAIDGYQPWATDPSGVRSTARPQEPPL